jgi:hypothetical protein
MPLESRTLRTQKGDPVYGTKPPCEFPGCKTPGGPKEASTVLYIAGYPIGRYCSAHARMMRKAWITDEALLAERTFQPKPCVAYPAAA